LSHTTREKAKLLARVRRIRGQVEAIERALESEAGCSEVLHLLAGARGAMNGLMAEVIGDHVREHVAAGDLTESERAQGADELLEVIRAYLK
jgi:DNA-binding FrmR family transcriptional regulator